jgi:hypothetical protein
MSATSEFSEVSAIFYKTCQSLLNLLLRLMKVFYLVMIQTLAHTMFSMYDAMFDETNGSQKEQVDLDLVDDEKAPCDTLQRMVIGDIRPQDPSNQTQETFPNDTTLPV